MRLTHLDLIRYGRFTDRRIELPLAERDFHFILGPNEAGKSTTRSAISDLLFGIPARTRLAFLHAMPDLRLGAGLMDSRQPGSDAVLEVQRVKGNKQTLRDRADKPLPDNALAPFIGNTDGDFFNQMFSLDHGRMVQGGRSILAASDNLGQILFQSAAGIAGLGQVRDALQAEADRLWSPRRAKDRQFYIAADELEAATAALKSTTVRTKAWVDAHDAMAAAEQAFNQLREQVAAVRQQRARLERIRRVLPTLQALQSLRAQRDAMGAVVELPPSAAQTLLEAERAMGIEQVAIDHQAALLAQAKTALAEIPANTALLDAAAEITDLDEQRVQYRAYATDMPRRQAECDAQWAIALRLAAQLGWTGAGEQGLLARLPPQPLRTTLARLARDGGPLRQAADATRRAVRKKQAEFDQTTATLAQLPAAQLPLELQAALQRAKKLGDVATAVQAATQQVAKSRAALETALAALGRWRAPVADLLAMTPPAADALQALQQDSLQDAAQARALATRITQLAQQAEQAALDARQYRASHDTVSRDELDAARQQRDRIWQSLKADPTTLPQQSDDFELQLNTADALADRRHDTAQEASELQARLAQEERARMDLRQARDEEVQLQQRTDRRQAQWATLAEGCGLAGLPFEAAPAWLAARSRALDAAAAAADTQTEAQRLQLAVADAWDGLTRALGQSAGQGATTDTAPVGDMAATAAAASLVDVAALDRLMLEAEARAHAAATVSGQRKALDKQRNDAQDALLALADDARAAELDLERWTTQWRQGLAEAGLAADAEPSAVEAQLAQLDEMAQALEAMRRIRVDRLDKMQADLDRHAAAAQALAQRLQPTLAAQPADLIVRALTAQLAEARALQERAQRLRVEVTGADEQLRAATLRRDQARASLAALMQRAGTASIAALPDAIARSDRWRALQTEATAAERAAAEAGDGLSLAQLQGEASGTDPIQLVGELGSLAAKDEELVNALSAAAAHRQAATATLQAIAGTADAAQAEARRQQALAAMADAVERYIKVFTAARLLGWSIERYRETRQGPMLSAASGVFAQLTRGSFDRLVVDFEHDPPRLQGHRPDGALVDIDGMSEGTQDQLFLALRLAALDLHLNHAQALPFIADDLFVNHDDARAIAGLQALGELSRKTQVLFFTHHAHLLPLVQQVFADRVNIVRL
ncbi:MAG TPA: AAA family ATPase [Burkholderiaceae bacterium]|nr:AAA family ATPase [Burkholderiaceae bacterium]